jgi:anti-anti-sigma regulatory factor
MSEHTCSARGNSLVIEGDFSVDTDTGFDEACQQVLGSADRQLVVDLTAVDRICSTYIGLLGEMCLAARRGGKEVLIRSAPKIHKLLSDAGLGHAARLENVG